MVDTKAFYDGLLKRNIDFFAGVPDSLLAELCACIKENSPADRNIIAANEGNALSIIAGYHISSGKYGVVYMQNSGQGNIVNPLLSLADEDVYRIPMLLIIGWRGEPGKKDEPQHKKQGKLTLSLLECMGVEYQVLSDNYEEQIEYAYQYMVRENKPYALVVQKGSFSKYALKKAEPVYPMKREEALKVILSSMTEDDFLVSTTGKTSREIFEIREANGQAHSHDFLTVGSMGHTSSIAMGMAMGTDARVYCIDGDGSFIMHMGAAAITAQNAPENFKYILINNGAHESVGGQPTVGFDIDVPAILKGCGYKEVIEAKDQSSLVTAMETLKTADQTAVIVYTRQGSRDDLGRPTVGPEDNKLAMMAEFAKRR